LYVFFGFCAQIGRLAGSPYSESPIFAISIRSHRNPKKMMVKLSVLSVYI